ncbi:VanZ family protein [Microbacterium sp. zg.B48]|uniref:VanZ family protein n=1 Tax=unclassified Microbacterium TaxID=2609290 RepID=UPI00214B88EB|nr:MULTISPECIES: VanZ family protein [unclassified Microbacterium]MCR2763624.1 VanZ family protein [Microbacterium sp. zg.B48]MCR2809344.1 VanZ family protein [Microbacterium sp. zg.B185]WIM20484.1 VanZ family protein [Microbacterium sp. zg-B185]
MSHATPTARRRGVRVVATALAALAVTVLTLAPRRLVAPARGAFMQFLDGITAPLLVWIPYSEAERALNAVLFLPLGATLALLLSRRFWPLAILGGFALSAAVEHAQASIPGRVPDGEDLLWNTVGGALGVLVVTVVRVVLAALTRPRQRGSVTRT